MGDEIQNAKAGKVRTTDVLIGLIMLAKFALQYATANRYGIFRDELYYLACAAHLSWGYVDQPPFVAGVAWMATHTLGTSLLSLRLWPALAGTALVWVTAQIAWEMGGNRFAQCLAAFATIPVPIYLMLNHWLTMNAFEPLFWASVVWLALRMLSRNEPRYWLAIGAVCGIGLENKYSMLILMAMLGAGLLATDARRILKTPWLPAGLLIALALIAPNLIWLAENHFPFLEFERNSRMAGSRIERNPLAFITDQIIMMNPLLAPLWIGGLVWLFGARQARPYRFIGWTFAGVFLLLIILKAKNYYVAPAYPMLFAAGAVAFEQITLAKQSWWARTAYVSAAFVSGAFLTPFVIPVLPLREFLSYQNAFHGFNPIRMENLTTGLLPQQFADEFGWKDLARVTGQAYAKLPLSERKDTAIFANNYGEAAAIDYFGSEYGLPKSICNNETYWLWGPRNYTGASMIVLGSDGQGDRRHFKSVVAVGRTINPYTRADERFNIFLCRNLKTTLRKDWPAIKNY